MTRALLTLVLVSGFQLRYDPALLRRHEIKHLAKLTAQQNGTDIPIDVGPARDQIVFPDNGRDGPDTITFLPLRDATVPNFAKAYPQPASYSAALRRALAAPAARMAAQLERSDLACIDNGHAFHAHVKPLKFPWGEGVAFLTQYSQEGGQSNPPNNQELVWVFLGLTRGGTHYIRAEFAVRHPGLPATMAAAGRHSADALQNFKHLPASGFSPNLDALESVLGSVQPLN